jgi:hypothetical protein
MIYVRIAGNKLFQIISHNDLPLRSYDYAFLATKPYVELICLFLQLNFSEANCTVYSIHFSCTKFAEIQIGI